MATTDRALTLEILINRHGDKTPADIAKVLRGIADHLDDDFTDTEDNGELRNGVGHFVYHETKADLESIYEDAALCIGYWKVNS